MAKSLLSRTLKFVVSNGWSGLGWAIGTGLALVRGNFALLLGVKRPGLVFLWAGASFGGIGNATLGRFIRLGRHARIQAWPGGTLQIGDHFSLGEMSVIENGFGINGQRGSIVIGNNVGIGAFSFISCPSRVEIGSDCIVGQYLSVHPQNHNFEGEGPIRLQGTTEKGVVIGSDCWIGAKVTILDGVTIGDGCVIAAGAVVTKSFAPHSVVGGCPARLLAIRPRKAK